MSDWAIRIDLFVKNDLKSTKTYVAIPASCKSTNGLTGATEQWSIL